MILFMKIILNEIKEKFILEKFILMRVLSLKNLKLLDLSQAFSKYFYEKFLPFSPVKCLI